MCSVKRVACGLSTARNRCRNPSALHGSQIAGQAIKLGNDERSSGHAPELESPMRRGRSARAALIVRRTRLTVLPPAWLGSEPDLQWPLGLPHLLAYLADR